MFDKLFKSKPLSESEANKSFYEKVKEVENVQLKKDIKEEMDSLISVVKSGIISYSKKGYKQYEVYISSSSGEPFYIQGIYKRIVNGFMPAKDVVLAVEESLGKEFSVKIKDTLLYETYELIITWK